MNKELSILIGSLRDFGLTLQEVLYTVYETVSRYGGKFRKCSASCRKQQTRGNTPVEEFNWSSQPFAIKRIHHFT